MFTRQATCSDYSDPYDVNKGGIFEITGHKSNHSVLLQKGIEIRNLQTDLGQKTRVLKLPFEGCAV